MITKACITPLLSQEGCRAKRGGVVPFANGLKMRLRNHPGAALFEASRYRARALRRHPS
jgi:hypothetical protein